MTRDEGRMSGGSDEKRPRTFTERARREQLLEATVTQIAVRGYGGASLARIAEAAGISKAAVLYHVGSKDALVNAAYTHVLDTLVASVGAAVERADIVDRPAAYIRAMVVHLRDHPQHTGVLAEVGREKGVDHAREERWAPLAGLIEAAARARGTSDPGGRTPDSRALAVLSGGAIDAIMSERLEDDDFDVEAAADLLISMLPN